jgi:hypothetical protein
MTAFRAPRQERFLTGFIHRAVRGISLSITSRSRSEAPVDEPRNTLAGQVTGPPPLIDGHALGDLLRQHTPWSAVPASIPPVVTLVSWCLLICDAAVTAWLTGVTCGSLGCAGPLCTVATLSGHPLLTLSLAAGSLLALVILAFLTRAYRIGTAPVLVALGASSLVAAVAVMGAVALVLLALLMTAAMILLIVVLLSR